MSPLKVFEYMSSGKAIVCADFPVLREVLSDDNAILVNPEDRDGWVSAIERLKDRNLREQLGQQAYQDFLEHYTWKKRAAKVLEKFNQI
jgi:glycosyltransferase involved in cell wall biosynthesis